MDGEIIGLVAVILVFAVPLAGFYTFYRVRQLRTQERLAALARGAEIPMEPELSQAAKSRRAGILLVTGAIGYMVTFALIARILGEPETLVAATFGIIPLAIGIGYFLDFGLVRRDARAS
jgi:preprotein translocase subunit Sss1